MCIFVFFAQLLCDMSCRLHLTVTTAMAFANVLVHNVFVMFLVLLFLPCFRSFVLVAIATVVISSIAVIVVFDVI